MIDRRTLFVGLGTPHGDDHVGFCVAEQLARCEIPGVQVELARTPLEVLDLIENVERLVVCDACQSGMLPVGTISIWEWPVPEIETHRFAGTHDFSLPAILTLAGRLGRLPRTVLIVGVAVRKTERGDTMSQELRVALHSIVQDVYGVLARA